MTRQVGLNARAPVLVRHVLGVDERLDESPQHVSDQTERHEPEQDRTQRSLVQNSQSLAGA